jgi:hypothetical protein
MQISPRAEGDVDPEAAARATIQAQARLWTLLALGSVVFALNVVLGLVAAILAQIAKRAARRGEIGAATASLRWARLLTLIGVVLFAIALAACVTLYMLQRSR